MVFEIAKKEIRSAFRDRAVYLMAGLLYILATAAFLGSYVNYLKTDQDRKDSAALFKHEWEEQESNPHSAAHYGTYLFKPNTALSLFDKGLLDYMGTTYRVEAHYQHEVNYAVAQDNSADFRFGQLTIALILQLIIPLMIIFLGFSAISKEREGSTLKMMLAQGLSFRQLLWGKFLGVYLLVLMMVLPLFVGMGIASTFLPFEGAVFARCMLMLISYLLYYFIITGLVVLVSAKAGSSKASLQFSLWGWVLLGVLLPRLFTALANNTFPLPSRSAFNELVDKGYSEGLGDDGSRRERYEAYKEDILAQYGKDSVENLPINFDGLSMQHSEDYQSKVYSKYASEVEQLINRQNTLLGYLGFADPIVAIRHLSMGYAGTDYQHHIDFHKKAREYRDNFVRKLNMEMTYAEGSTYLSYDYQVGPDFFKNMEVFNYELPLLQQMITAYLPFMYAILFWGLLTGFAMWSLAKRIDL